MTRRLHVVTKCRSIILLSALCLVIPQTVSMADDTVALTGTVADDAGKPIEHATVIVYRAGVKKGYSLFCPTCYVDCGKRAVTDEHGTFVFKRLNPDLWFDLLVARDGYSPVFAKKIDPSSGRPVTAILAKRKTISDPDRVFRGVVKDSVAFALRDAVVEPVGILLDSKTGSSLYGQIDGLDPIAISNEKGEFELAYSKLAPKLLVKAEARAMAPTFAVIPVGLRTHTVTVMHGATVRGRLVLEGKPVADAEVGLISRERGGFDGNLKIIGHPYDEIRIGTGHDGMFTISNVPTPGDWYIYGKMESLAKRGTTGAVEIFTKHDKEIVEVGELPIKPAHHLQGRIVLSDGRLIPDEMRVTISSATVFDSQTMLLPPDGRFAFAGLAVGNYSIFASVKGYSPPPMTPVSIKTKDGRVVTYTPPPPPLSVEHDVDNFVITLHPDK